MKVYLKDNLRWLRERTGYTQQIVADKINIKKNTYGNYETGYSSPDFLILKKLSNEFGYSVDELLYQPLDSDTNKEEEGNNKPQKNNKKAESFQKESQPSGAVYNVYDIDGAPENIAMLSDIEKQNSKSPSFYQPRLGPGLHVRLQLTGDSMHSTVKDNDFVIATYVPEALTGNIREGAIYVLVDENEGIICKRVYEADDNSFELVSDNETYKPYKREKKCILAMYKVVQVQSSDLKNYNTDKELLMLWKKVNEITNNSKR